MSDHHAHVPTPASNVRKSIAGILGSLNPFKKKPAAAH